MAREPRAGGRRPRVRPERTAVQKAIGLLTRREHSRQELLRKLAVGGAEPEEARAAVERLAEAGWQDEARFAESLVRTRHGQGYGPLHIRAELASHGLARELVASAMEGDEYDWDEAAVVLATRRFGAPATWNLDRQRKVAALLARRGFGHAQIVAIVRDIDD